MTNDCPSSSDPHYYRLPDESQHLLEQVRDQLHVLSSLAMPRSREEENDPVPLTQLMLAHCFLLLAASLDRVMSELR